jgi:hypothetical protein
MVSLEFAGNSPSLRLHSASSPQSAFKSTIGILETLYLICSRPDWHGAPGIPRVLSYYGQKGKLPEKMGTMLDMSFR